MSEEDVPIEPAAGRTLSTRFALIATVVAFLAGLLVMGLTMRQFGWRGTTAEPAVRQSTAQPSFSPPAVAPAAQPAVPTNLTTLDARESALDAQLAALETRQVSLSAQAQAAAGYAGRAEGMMVAFAARRALDRGVALGYIDGQLRARFGQTQPRAVAVIVQASRQPVTLEDLQEGLATLAPDLVTGTTRDGWLVGLRRELSGLVSVRHEGTPSPRPVDRMDRARRLLDGGQVEAALAEVARLPGAPQADNWVKAARRYIAARRALDVVEMAALLGQNTPSVAAPAAQPQTAPLSAN